MDLLTQTKDQLTVAGVKPSDGLVVAVSGGVDSMVLLDLMRRLENPLVVVHVNHGLRKTANRDEAVVRQYCDKHRLELVVRSVNLGNKKTGVEERAREMRYEALRGVAKQTKLKWIVVAHTADDQVETVVANWLRGSLVRGLGGMRLVNGEVVRPLLDVPKAKLTAYAKQHKLKYVVDETNFDVQFTRNQIRHQLLPVLKKFNPKLDNQIGVNAKLWQEVDLTLETLARQYLLAVGKIGRDRVVLSVSKLNELTGLMRGEVLKLAVQLVGGGLANLKRVHFEEVLKIVVSPRQVVAKRRLGGELFCSKACGKITISRD